VDAFGARTWSAETRRFDTDNTNGIPGILTGIVYSDSDFTRLAGATLTLAVEGFEEPLVTTTEADGSYSLLMPAGSTSTLTVSGDGLTETQVEPAPLDPGEEQTVFVGVPVLSGNLDIDGDGNADALTDGLLVLRYLFGFRGEALISGAVVDGAPRASAEAIEAYLEQGIGMLDIDGNTSADALTDGLLVLRYQFGFRGAALIDGAVDGGASRITAGAIESYLLGQMP